jgi:hypothetical protein
MRSFNQFLAEQDEVINVDNRMLENNFDSTNNDLDAITEKPFQNAPIFLASLRNVLDRYGIGLPASATKEFLHLDAELNYALGDSGYYLYAVYDTRDDGFVDAYAQIVTPEELDALLSTDSSEMFSGAPVPPTQRMLPARRDDDSGNTDEYA